MNIIVMIKQVPGTGPLDIDENGILIRDDTVSVLDPFSFFALKMALDLREKTGGKITAVTMGPMHAVNALKECLGYGADDAFLLSDKDFSGSDTWATARVLSAFIKKEMVFDHIFCGVRTSDGNTAQVPAELSVLLGTEFADYVTGFDYSDGVLSVTQDYDHESRRIGLSAPSVIAVLRGPLAGECPVGAEDVSDAQKPIHVRNRVNIGLGAYSAGKDGSHTNVTTSMMPLPIRKMDIVIDGSDPEIAADHLVNLMRAV